MSRQACVDALAKILSKDQAIALETAIHEKNGTEEEYKHDVLSKLSNLKRNDELLEAYSNGTVSANELANMTPEDMATPSKRAETEKIRASLIDETIGVDTLQRADEEDDDLDRGVVRNTGQKGLEYDAP